MIRWMTLTLGCTILILTLVSIVALVARAQPQPHPVVKLGFGMCDERPCFMGLIPGITSAQQAREVMLKQGGTQVGSELLLRVEDVQVRVGLTDRVSYIVATYFTGARRGMMPFHRLVQEFGPPCKVLATIYAGRQMMVVYPFMSVEITLSEQRISFDSPVTMINLWDSRQRGRAAAPLESLCRAARETTDWVGFTAQDRYARLVYVR